jgi:hypothetical protein
MTPPTTVDSVVPVLQEVTVETSKGEGQVIAIAWTGNTMTYLVVSRQEQSAPRWTAERDINAAYIGGRPGGFSFGSVPGS